LSVQAFLTDEGYDPIYGARPLRRAIMKYLEDTLAEQCLSKTLYPNTKIHVRRKKVEGTLMTYTNELEVEVDFSDVDPSLLEESVDNVDSPVATLSASDETSDQGKDEKLNPVGTNDFEPQDGDFGSSDEGSKSVAGGRATRFFRKKTK